MASSSRQSDEVRVSNLLKCLTLTTIETSTGPGPLYTPHSWVKCEIDKSAKPDDATKSTRLTDNKKSRRKSKSGLHRSSKSTPSSAGNRSPKKRDCEPHRTCKSAQTSNRNRSPRAISPRSERTSKSSRPWQSNLSPRTRNPRVKRASKSARLSPINRSPRAKTLTLPRTSKSARQSHNDRSPGNRSPQRKGILDISRSSDNSHGERITSPVPLRPSGRYDKGSLSPRNLSPVSKRTSKSAQASASNRFPRIKTFSAPSKPNSTSLTETASSSRSGTTDSTRSRGSTIDSRLEVYSRSSRISGSTLIGSSTNTTKSVGSTTLSCSDSDGGSSKTCASSWTSGTGSTTKSVRSIVDSCSTNGSSKTSGSFVTTDTGTTASAWTPASSVDSQSNILCLVHGPSTASLQQGRLKCDRCIKRPMKTRMDRQEPVSRKEDAPPIVPMAKKQKLMIAKKPPEPYLQVSALPMKLTKTIETLKKERQCRLRYKDETARMMLKRDIRMNDICCAYELSRPYLYKPFLSHLICLRQSQRDMNEYMHNVQAVVQSVERRDNLKSLASMRSKRDKFYRTTKIAAWKALHIQDGTMPWLDILQDSDAKASFRYCRLKIDQFCGPRPQATVSENCTLCRKRRYCSDKHKPNFLKLKSYRWQTTHKYSIPYMVKAIVRMNQALKGRRNFAILKHLRTVYIVKKLFNSYREKFREELKQFLMEHANNLDNSTMLRRWTKFLMTRKPTERAGDVMALNCALDLCPELKLGQHRPDCDVCENLKEAIRNAKRDIAKIKDNIREITRDKTLKTLREAEVASLSQEDRSSDIDESIKAKKAEMVITVIMPTIEDEPQTSVSLERLAKEIVGNVYKKLDEQLVKRSSSEAQSSWDSIDKLEIAEIIVSDVLKRITQPSQDDHFESNTSFYEDIYSHGSFSDSVSLGNIAERVVSDVLKRITDLSSKDSKSVSFDDDLTDKIVMYVLKRISERQSSDAIIRSLCSSCSDTASKINEEEVANKVVSAVLKQLDVYLQGVTQRSRSDTKSQSDSSYSLYGYCKSDSLNRILVNRIVSDVIKGITKTTSEESATFQEYLLKPGTSYDVDELADKITMHVLKQIAGQQSKSEIVAFLVGSLSDVASSASLNEDALVNRIVTRVLKQLDDYLQEITQTSLSDTKLQSDSSFSLYQRFEGESLSNFFVERIVAHVLRRITGPQSENIATSLKDLVTGDAPYHGDEIARKINTQVRKLISGQESEDDYIEILAGSFREAVFQRNLAESSASLDDDALASRIVLSVLQNLAEQESKRRDAYTKGDAKGPLRLSESGYSDSCSSISIFVERIVSDVLHRITKSRSEEDRVEDLKASSSVKSCTSYNVDRLAEKITMHVLKQITDQRRTDGGSGSRMSSISDATFKTDRVQSGASFDEDELVNKIVSGVLREIAEDNSNRKDAHLQGGTQRSLSGSRPMSGHSDRSSLLDKATAPKIYLEPAIDDRCPSLDNVEFPKILVELASDNTESDQSLSKTSMAYESPQELDSEVVPYISSDVYQDTTTTASPFEPFVRVSTQEQDIKPTESSGGEALHEQEHKYDGN